MNMAKQTICVKVEPSMKAKIQIIAKREGRGVADVFRAAALAYIEKHEDKYGRISANEIKTMELLGNKRGE